MNVMIVIDLFVLVWYLLVEIVLEFFSFVNDVD